MDNSITPNKIKQNNRNMIYNYIYKNRKVSQQDICYNLHLSRPTVTTNLTVLETEGLIKKHGQIDTEFVGRKATAYSIVPDYRIAIGVEILKEEIKIIAVNLYSDKIERLVFEIEYRNDPSYYKTVCDKILEFKDAAKIADECILGIGFAMQALISPNKKNIVYGKILSCTGLPITAFSEHLPYPCSFVHDADSAAISELWASPELTDAFYLSISKHLGASIISNGKILTGKHGHNATIEHIKMQSEGLPCYCGKTGCMETLCSLTALLTEKESLEYFFENVRKREPSFLKRWQIFLSHLANAINLLHLVYDTDFILGGYLAPYLREEDLAFLHEKIRQTTPFPESADFLMISKMPEHNISIGAALPYIQAFLNTITN